MYRFCPICGPIRPGPYDGPAPNDAGESDGEGAGGGRVRKGIGELYSSLGGCDFSDSARSAL